MGHNKKLSFTHFKDKSINDQYVLFFYGDFILKKNNSVLFIEAYFFKRSFNSENLSSKEYFDDNVEKVVLEFTKSLLFPKNAIFDSTGKILSYPITNFEGKSFNGTYRISNLYFNPTNLVFYTKKSFISEVSNTNVPSVGSLIKRNDFLSNYYFYTNPNSNTDYIIPSEVFYRYFYGYSTLVYDIVANNKIKFFLKHRIIISNNIETNFVFYDKKLISKEEVVFLAKFLFISDDFAMQTILKLSNEIYKIRLSEIDNECLVPMKFEFPIPIPVSLNVIGNYISTYGDKKKKFLVSQISSIQSYNNNEIFDTKKIVLKDISDKTKEEDTDEDIKLNLAEFEDRFNRIFNDKGASSGSTSDVIVSIANVDNFEKEDIPFFEQNLFLDSPLFDDTDEIFLNGAEISNIFCPPPDAKNIKNNGSLKNYRYYKIEWFDIIDKAMIRLDKENLFNVSQYYSTGKGKKMLICDIKVYGKYYLLLEFGGGFYSPIFRLNTFEKITRETLDKVLKIASNVNFSWPEIYYVKETSDLNIVFLTSNQHSIYEIIQNNIPKLDEERMIDEAYKKTRDKILKDIKINT